MARIEGLDEVFARCGMSGSGTNGAIRGDRNNFHVDARSEATRGATTGEWLRTNALFDHELLMHYGWC